MAGTQAGLDRLSQFGDLFIHLDYGCEWLSELPAHVLATRLSSWEGEF
jgi:hypothetical protein